MVEFRVATADDCRAIAVLRWESAAEDGPPQSCEAFAAAFADWAQELTATHTAFVAAEGSSVVGSAWLAQVPRAPDPWTLRRANGDLQTVFVIADRRNEGIGEALVRAVLAYGWRQGLGAMTVAANERAASLYRRIGFAGDPMDLRLAAPEPDNA